MKFFKVTLSELAGTRKTVMYLVPEADEYDEDGVPVFDEETVRNFKETHEFAKKINSNTLHLRYELFEAASRDEAEGMDDFLRIEAEENIKKISENDFHIDINKKLKSYYDNDRKNKSNAFLYILIFAAIAVAAVFALILLYPPGKPIPFAPAEETEFIISSDIIDSAAPPEEPSAVTPQTSVPIQTGENGSPGEPERTTRTNRELPEENNAPAEETGLISAV